MASVTTHGLTRRFGDVIAVDDLTLDLPDAGVVGLVGPNGSGKSTLIRMLLGLVAPSAGEATVLGHPVTRPWEYAPRVGALVEGPAFVPALSARRNLASLARLRGLGDARVGEVLDRVGLTGRDDEPVRRFSLGMEQRLGIAAALLPDPDLLILDEPTNGLDPAGIVEIRGLLRSLAAEGRTVVVSSHLLSEIEAACDALVVIRFGRLMFAGPVAELMSRAHARVRMIPEHAADLPRLAAAVQGAGWEAGITGDGLEASAAAAQAAEFNRVAHRAGITLAGLSVSAGTLEEVFLAMTGTDDGQLATDRALAATAGRAA